MARVVVRLGEWSDFMAIGEWKALSLDGKPGAVSFLGFADVVELLESARDDVAKIHAVMETGDPAYDRGVLRHEVRLAECCLSAILGLTVALCGAGVLRDDQQRLLTAKPGGR